MIKTDLTQRDDIVRLEARLRDDDAISLLINNAGAALFGDFADADPDALEGLVQLNVVAVTRLAQAASARFLRRGRGTIVNISSIVGLAPELFPGSVYGATKAYVTYLTQTLHAQLAPQGLTFQAVLPGATRTEIWDRSGRGIENVPDEILMPVDELVDAALAGLDKGELITIPSLPDPADWATVEAARLKLAPNLSAKHPADRYGVRVTEAA